MTKSPPTKDEILKREYLKLLQDKEEYQRYHKINSIFPDEGRYPRSAYPKHIDFINKGAIFRQRAFIAANRTGKTVTGAYEVACHVTGVYPHWWKGKKFSEAVEAWVASRTNEDTKEIMQKELLGDINDQGSGMIPKELLGKPTKKPGVANALESIYVKHISGRDSRIVFKSYEQGREGFQGTKKQVIWLDEEPRDPDIYTECLTRTMDADNPGIIICTFTPLLGLSDVVLSFMPGGILPRDGTNPENPYKFITQVTWEEAPHLTELDKKELLATYAIHERDARTKGIPSLGAGAIYPYSEDDITVEPFEIPFWWPKAYGMDVGWRKTAAIWGAVDRDSGKIYIYSEHYQGETIPALHASAIKARGDWITGAVDPRADKRAEADGTQLMSLYLKEGLNLVPAQNAVESGIYHIQQLFSSGQLKIFSNCTNLLNERRIYRRDEHGRVVKSNDHALDAMRYLIETGLHYAVVQPDKEDNKKHYKSKSGRSKTTGY